MGVILDVAIGLVFLYLLLALVATTVQELIATVLRLRAQHLYDAIADMLKGNVATSSGSKPIVVAFYEHPLIRNLCKTPPKFNKGELECRWPLPSYIPSRAFALALLDVLRGDTTISKALGARDVLAKAGATVDEITNNDDLKRILTLFAEDVAGEADALDAAAARVSQRIETLFNDRMARASGWYKRQAQWIALLIAASIAAIANADTIHVVQRLWQDAPLRNAVVTNAQAYVDAAKDAETNAGGSLTGAGGATAPADGASASSAVGSAGGIAKVKEAAKKLDQSRRTLADAGLPIGWRCDEVCGRPLSAWLWSILGWAITALAVSLGSNFWFDVLSSALQLRGGGAKVSAATGRVRGADEE